MCRVCRVRGVRGLCVQRVPQRRVREQLCGSTEVLGEQRALEQREQAAGDSEERGLAVANVEVPHATDDVEGQRATEHAEQPARTVHSAQCTVHNYWTQLEYTMRNRGIGKNERMNDIISA